MTTANEMDYTTQAQKQKKRVRKWLEGGNLRAALDAQGKAGRGSDQIVTILAAEKIIVTDLRWRYDYPSLDVAIQGWLNKARRWGNKSYPLSDKQKDWAAGFLQGEFNKALACAEEQRNGERKQTRTKAVACITN